MLLLVCFFFFLEKKCVCLFCRVFFRITFYNHVFLLRLSITSVNNYCQSLLCVVFVETFLVTFLDHCLIHSFEKVIQKKRLKNVTENVTEKRD